MPKLFENYFSTLLVLESFGIGHVVPKRFRRQQTDVVYWLFFRRSRAARLRKFRWSPLVKTREILHFWFTLGQLGLSPLGPKMFAVLKNTKKLDILFIFVLSGKWSLIAYVSIVLLYWLATPLLWCHVTLATKIKRKVIECVRFCVCMSMLNG